MHITEFPHLSQIQRAVHTSKPINALMVKTLWAYYVISSRCLYMLKSNPDHLRCLSHPDQNHVLPSDGWTRQTPLP